jgi:hypothetical protein
VKIFWAKAAALHVLVVKGVGFRHEMVRLKGRGVARPVLGKFSGGNVAPALDTIGVSRLSAEQVKGPLLADVGEEFLTIMFLVREDQGLVGRCRRGSQNLGCHPQELGAGLHDRLGRRTEAKTDRLAGVTIQQEKGLSHFGGFLLGTEAVPAPLALAVAGHAVRVQSQESAGEMSSRAAQFAQGDLQWLGFWDGVALQEVVDGQVGGDEGQAVGQFKALLGKGAPLAVGAQTPGRFIDPVEGQARLDSVGRQAGPGAHEVPGAQAQVLGQQEPDADLIARNLIGQDLADLPLQALGIGWQGTLFFASALGLNKLGRVGGIKCGEFFFAGRNRR